MVSLGGEGAPCLLGFLFSLSHGTGDGLGIPSHLQSLGKRLLSLFAGEEERAHTEGVRVSPVLPQGSYHTRSMCTYMYHIHNSTCVQTQASHVHPQHTINTFTHVNPNTYVHNVCTHTKCSYMHIYHTHFLYACAHT